MHLVGQKWLTLVFDSAPPFSPACAKAAAAEAPGGGSPREREPQREPPEAADKAAWLRRRESKARQQVLGAHPALPTEFPVHGRRA